MDRHRQQPHADVPGQYYDYDITGYQTNFPLNSNNVPDSQYSNYTNQDFSYDHNQSNYVYGHSYSSNYISLAATEPQVPAVVNTILPRVHINPNYRPKACIPSETERPAGRSASVHINPHWKPRLETVSAVSCDTHENYSRNNTVGKKTIFVNPRILANMKRKSPSESDVKYPSSDCQSGNASLAPHLPLPENANRMSNVKCEEPKSVSMPSVEPTFVVLSSTKLVRRLNIPPILKSSELSPSLNSSISKAREIPKKICSPRSNTLRIAKQLSSKYKVVRHSTCFTSPMKFVRGATSNPSRRSRRKSINCRLPMSSHPKSKYKFVRKVESLEPCTRVPPMEQVKMIATSSEITPKVGSQLNLKGSSRACTNLRTRYKLIKIQPSNEKCNADSKQEKKSKTIKTRYKLVHIDSAQSITSSKSILPFNRRRSAGSILPVATTFLNSHQKIFKSYSRYTVTQGRKVSRFKIIHPSETSKSKIRNSQRLIQICKNHVSFNCRKKLTGRADLYSNIIWKKGKMLPTPGKILSTPHLKADPRTLVSIASTGRKRRYHNPTANKSCNRNLLNIGGVLYKSTRTTLTRTQPRESKEQVVHIRGKRYVLDANGLTLRPTSSPEDCAQATVKSGLPLSRVDIGGVTFTRRSDNTLVRTNTHHTRNLLSVAKMKSIALLTHKLRKNNQPCLIFHRFGKCHAYEEGKCWRLHDPKNISICRKFLQGTCEIQNCLLSHAVGPEKMPTCKYFLEGCCVRDNCPYLHVKLSSRAAICRQFLHGYCAAGDTCKKRHIFLCPDFDLDGKCSKGKYCPYPHQDKPEAKPKKGKTKYSTKQLSLNKTEAPTCDSMNLESKACTASDSEKRNRYYDKNRSFSDAVGHPQSNDSEIQILSLSDEDSDSQADNDDTNKRSKIGVLPAYIPL